MELGSGIRRMTPGLQSASSTDVASAGEKIRAVIGVLKGGWAWDQTVSRLEIEVSRDTSIVHTKA